MSIATLISVFTTPKLGKRVAYLSSSSNGCQSGRRCGRSSITNGAVSLFAIIAVFAACIIFSRKQSRIQVIVAESTIAERICIIVRGKSRICGRMVDNSCWATPRFQYIPGIVTLLLLLLLYERYSSRWRYRRSIVVISIVIRRGCQIVVKFVDITLG